MLAGFPGMADATGVSSAHGYEKFTGNVLTKRFGRKFLLPDSPGITDFMPVWGQYTRVAKWDPTKTQLIDGGGQYNGNIPIPIFRNLAASLTLDLEDTDVRVAAFGADLLEGLPPPAYPFDVNMGLARKGRELYQENCTSCHQPHNGKVYNNPGTDPSRANVINLTFVFGARASYTSICSPTTEVEMHG
jgi:hypothetical protein